MKLTNQEQRVSKLIAFGFSEKEIAAKLFIAESTVHTHTKNIRKKIKARSAVDVARFYILQNPKQFFITTLLVVVQMFSVFIVQDDQVRRFARRSNASRKQICLTV
ncbi:LuxR C-terminal-related transcriptional regulator [Polaribacter sp.]|uniref:response regulator transcription factor n=1 Tax=Polaribacter sp. TaxID=1920175 RepID=UPI0025F8496F|nr:LuxR C-terminal-related transcriptional regulator [Polaribacter sp.]